ncbi:MAG: L,D-transpeptidase [Bacteroidetes bacterium]|nr:L,D-transpeptidase [Bacteroidota bacterium]
MKDQIKPYILIAKSNSLKAGKFAFNVSSNVYDYLMHSKLGIIFLWSWFIIRIVLTVLIFSFLMIEGVTAISEFQLLTGSGKVSPDKTLAKEQDKLKESLIKDLAQLEKRMNTFTPIHPYIIINTTENKFYIYKGSKLLKEGKCSTGSYINLIGDNNKSWIFKTPRGERKILRKTKAPVWKKPDWAFIEEGIPVPSMSHSSRFEYNVLGDYSLALGDGYLIHGTIYKRQLGMPVTHGCVRLNDDDLEFVYKTLQIGSRVFIY